MRFENYEIEVTERANCRHFAMRCNPSDGQLRLSVPPRTPQRKINEFLIAQRAWIVAHAKPVLLWQPQYLSGEQHQVLGMPVVLGAGPVPSGQRAFETWRNKQLEQLVCGLMEAWSAQIGVRYRSIHYRQMISRWGSCQPRTGDIHFSTRLGCVPYRCVEYVVVHELCHLIHANHSQAFWETVGRFLPDWKERRYELNHFDIRPQPPAP